MKIKILLGILVITLIFSGITIAASPKSWKITIGDKNIVTSINNNITMDINGKTKLHLNRFGTVSEVIPERLKEIVVPSLEDSNLISSNNIYYSNSTLVSGTWHAVTNSAPKSWTIKIIDGETITTIRTINEYEEVKFFDKTLRVYECGKVSILKWFEVVKNKD